jgi:hypothetical protein
MSLRNLFQFGKRLLKGKKESAQPATGQQQKQITYEGKPSQATGQELAKQELKNPPVVLKKTKALQMGDDIAPAFGSSTYDWAMKIGRGKYSADEWLNHLTSTRQTTFRIFGKPAKKLERAEKRFKYDSGPFAGKEVNISKEELFDTNLAIFNQAGDLTGGLLYAAKKFGLKLDANEVGAMIKLNPVNRLKPLELGLPKGAQEKFDIAAKNLTNSIRGVRTKFRRDSDLVQNLDDAEYQLEAIKKGELGSGVFNNLRNSLRRAKARPDVREQEKKLLNQAEAELNASVAPMKNSKTKYGTESNYTLQGGKDYRETVFHLDEPIKSNRNLFTDPGHFSDTGLKNQIYHVRFDTRFTPDGKKVFMINEIQSDVNQSVAKGLSKAQQLGGISRVNPFQADLEMNLLASNRGKLMEEITEAIAKGQPNKARALTKEAREIQNKMNNVFQQRDIGSEKTFDYFPLVEADAYGDHALKYLMQKAAREGVDYVAVAPFSKLSFRQGYKAGNERFYGYATGKGIDNKGKAVMPELMKKSARFYNSKAGPTKISLSDPKMPYKKVKKDEFKYPDKTQKGKKITSEYHDEVSLNPFSGSKLIPEGDPRLYFDAFAIRVNPLMRSTQKTYKSTGGLVVDMFKPMRYN